MINDEPTPKWRRDFPIAWGADSYVTRREFTKFLVLVSGATTVGNGYFVFQRQQNHAQNLAPMEIAKVEELRPGGVKLFRYPTGDDTALLIRLNTGEYAAY